MHLILLSARYWKRYLALCWRDVIRLLDIYREGPTLLCVYFPPSIFFASSLIRNQSIIVSEPDIAFLFRPHGVDRDPSSAVLELNVAFEVRCFSS